MSYNLLLDTNFSKINKHWKLTNCTYKNGYLISNSSVYSIEQQITLPDPTKLYFSFDFIAFDKNIKKVYVGIQQQDLLESSITKPKYNKRVKLSVVYPVMYETVTVKFIVEAKTEDTKIYIDSPMLIDLCEQNKAFWAKWMLNKALDYRYGFDYENIYKECELTINNNDFKSSCTDVEKADTGILAYIKEKDWFKLNFKQQQGRYYLVKLDYEQVNDYGELFLKYGETVSQQIDKEQAYIVFRSDGINDVRIKMINNEKLDYIVNLKHILIVDITEQNFEEQDIPHLSYI